MGLNSAHALGRNQRFYAKYESSAGTYAKHAGTDALKVLKSSMEYVQERAARADARTSRSLMEQITRRIAVKWSLEKYLIPSGAAGTAPDDGELIRAALNGVETVSGGVSVTYAPGDSQIMRTLSLAREFNSVFGQYLSGGAVNTLKIALSGGDLPKISYEGFGWNAAHCGVAVTSGTQSAGASSVIVSAATARNLTVGAVIKVGVDDNTGAGYQITTANYSTYTFGVTPNLAGTTATGQDVVPFVPTETTGGSPAAGIDGAITLNATTLPLTSFELTLANNLKEINDEANQSTTTDYIPGVREVSGKFSVRARSDQIIRIGRARGFATEAISVACGTTAGKICTINIPYAEIVTPNVEAPESEEGTFELEFRAIGNSGADEMSVVFT